LTPSTLPIQPRVAEQASRDFVTIVNADRLHELEAEIAEAIEAHNPLPRGAHDRTATIGDWHEYDSRRLDQWRNADGWALREPQRMADQLARMLNCPSSAVAPYVVPELVSGDTARGIVLQVLRDLAGRIANEQRKVTRPRIAGRRSA
jgi:hypothetical protein